jgi:hypothetical protein
MMVHSLFDLASLALALAVYAAQRPLLAGGQVVRPGGDIGSVLYYASASWGALIGAYGLGCAELWLEGRGGVGRSVLGGLAGGILGVELYKLIRGWRGSTGLGFVLPLALGIALGRWGCQLSGLEDNTYGSATGFGWGWDYGDGVPRWPVAALESASMLCFSLVFLIGLKRGCPLFRRAGFPVFAAWYGLSRFLLEFLKPYPGLLGPFNLFHVVAAGLALYGLAMIRASFPPRCENPL